MKKIFLIPVMFVIAALFMVACAPPPDAGAAAAGKPEQSVSPTVSAVEIEAVKKPATAPPEEKNASDSRPESSGPPEAPEQLTAVAAGYVEAANAGDYEAAIALFDDEAVVSTPVGLFVGMEQVSAWMAENVKAHRADSQEWHMEGPILVNTGTVSLERFEQAGVGPVQYRAEYRISPSELITWFAPRVQLTPEQQEILGAAMDAPPPTMDDEIALAQAYVQAVNAGDFEQALAFFADDAVVSNPLGLFVGKKAIAEWLAEDVKTTRATHEQWIAQPPFVMGIGDVRLERFDRLGIGAVNSIAEFQVRDGKIVLFHPRVLLTPEQASVMQQAQAGQSSDVCRFAPRRLRPCIT